MARGVIQMQCSSRGRDRSSCSEARPGNGRHADGLCITRAVVSSISDLVDAPQRQEVIAALIRGQVACNPRGNRSADLVRLGVWVLQLSGGKWLHQVAGSAGSGSNLDFKPTFKIEGRLSVTFWQRIGGQDVAPPVKDQLALSRWQAAKGLATAQVTR